MENQIIIIIVAVLILGGIRSIIKRVKGKGSCCGGGGSTVKTPKKKLNSVIAKKTVIVEGMTCDHCKNRVERCINEIEGASGKVNLGKKEAVVSMEKEISDQQICTAIEKAGYTVIEIK